MLRCRWMPLFLLLAVDCDAQITAPDVTFAARPHAATYVCDEDYDNCGQVRWPDLGTYDLSVYLGSDVGEGDRLRFSIQLPAGWQIEAAEVCDASVVEGDLFDPAAGLEVQSSFCRGSWPPLLHLRVACDTPGTAHLWGFPGDPQWQSTAGARSRRCDGTWHAVYPGFPGLQAVSIGDPCGGILHGTACSYCILEPAGRMTPARPTFSLQAGTRGSMIVRVLGFTEYWCGLLPECFSGGYGPTTCYGGVVVSDDGSAGSGQAWLGLEFLEGDSSFHYFRITANAELLAAGSYDAALTMARDRCDLCQDVCVPVELQVLDAPVAASDGSPYGNPRAFLTPNPVRSGFALRIFDADDTQHISLDLFDAAGRRSAKLFDGPFDGRSLSGELPSELTPGVYFMRVRGERWTESIPIVVVH